MDAPTVDCDICGRPVPDPETHWPHNHHCDRNDCQCGNVTCPEHCWNCTGR